MLHSGSRGTGNRIGTYFIQRARRGIEKRTWSSLPDKDLAFFVEGEDALFDDYIEAVGWAQDFARANREVMMARILEALREALPTSRPPRSRSTATTTTWRGRATSAPTSG